MKKIIAILFASSIAVALSACSAADDSTITSPRIGNSIKDFCTFYTTFSTTSTYIIYKCEDDGLLYKCSSGSCVELDD